MHILLLDDFEHFWPLVTTYLNNINARDTVIATEAELEDALTQNPALIISGRRLAAHAAVAGSRIPLIVISTAGDAPPGPETSPARRKTRQLTWPLSRGVFLEATSTALGIEPRREFRSLMRLSRGSDRGSSLIESLDFSESGVGFLSSDYFALGTKITVSVSLPGTEGSLQLGCRIVRNAKIEDGRSWIYGAGFLDLDPAKRKLLRRFVLS